MIPIILSGCFDSSDDGDDEVTYAVGDHGPSGVGIVFYVTDGGLHGFEAAPVDQSTGIKWALPDYDEAFANGISELPNEIDTGQANTDAIIAQNDPDDEGLTTFAAGLARSYDGGDYTDWFLPSRGELRELRISGVGSLSTGYYWSSSEDYLGNKAWKVLDSGSSSNANKDETLPVRAIRAF